MSDLRVALEQPERVLYRIDQRPVEVEDLLSGTPREDDLGRASAGGSTFGEVAAQVVERDAVSSR